MISLATCDEYTCRLQTDMQHLPVQVLQALNRRGLDLQIMGGHAHLLQLLLLWRKVIYLI